MENAELYSSANGMQKRDAEEIISEFCDKLKWSEEPTVLDVGCGSGEVTAQILLPRLPKGFNQLIGLDVSQEMIQHAKSVHNHPKISFAQFDIAQESDNILEDLSKSLTASENNNVEIRDIENRLEVVSLANVGQNIKILLNDRKILECNRSKECKKAKGYDVVLSFYCLHWVQNQRLALKNINRLLKPGGEALLVLLASSPIFALYDNVSKLPLWKEYMEDVEKFISPYHKSINPLQDFKEAIKCNGFTILTSECKEKKYAFDSMASLQSAIMAVNPFIPRIPDDLQNLFINDCLEKVEELKLAERKSGGYDALPVLENGRVKNKIVLHCGVSLVCFNQRWPVSFLPHNLLPERLDTEASKAKEKARN